MTDVSVIFVNYKTPRLTVEAITSLKASTQLQLEIWVVDNASGDDSQRQVLTAHPQVHYLQSPDNVGFGRANNLALRQATGRYVLLLNTDTLQNGPVLDEMVRRLDAEPGVVAAAPMQLYANGMPQPYYTSFADLRRTFYIVPLRWQRLLEKLIPATHYTDPRQHDWLVGAFLLVRAEAARRTGGFDGRFFMYGEDVEWCHRLGRLGKLLYFKDLTFIHLVKDSAFRPADRSYVNRFGTQMQVSNLLWVRLQYGVGAYAGILLNYLLLVPAFFGFKVLTNLLQGRPLTGQLHNQQVFLQKIKILLRYAGPTLRKADRLFRLRPEENIR